MRYRLAGAYDSNVALLLATGDDRARELASDWSRSSAAPRSAASTSRPTSSSTTASSRWFLARDPWAKPTTKFVVPYLTLVGELAQEAQAIDLDYAFQQIARARDAAAPRPRPLEATRQRDRAEGDAARAAHRACCSRSRTSSRRGSAQHRRDFASSDERVVWQRNPVRGARRDLSPPPPRRSPSARGGAPHLGARPRAARDARSASTTKLAARVPARIAVARARRDAARRRARASASTPRTWARVRAAHAGHQLGLDILALLPLIARARSASTISSSRTI